MKSKKPTLVESKNTVTKKKKNKKIKKSTLFLLIIVVLGISIFLFRKISILNNINDHIDSLDNEYTELQNELKGKKDKAKDISSDEYITKKARDELKLVFPDEKIIVVPDKD